MTSVRLLVVAIGLSALSPVATAADRPVSTSSGAALTYSRLAADLFCSAVPTVSRSMHRANGQVPVASIATCLFDATPYSDLVTAMRRAALRIALGSAGIPVVTTLEALDDPGLGGQHPVAGAGGLTSPLLGLAPSWSPTLFAWLPVANPTSAPLSPSLWAPPDTLETRPLPGLDAPILALPLPL